MPTKKIYELNKEKYKANRKRWYIENKEKALSTMKEYAKSHPETTKKAIKKYYIKNKSKILQYNIDLRRNKMGFTKEIFDKQLEVQNNMCAICGDKFNEDIPMKKKAADHCHLSNKPRGILCRNCNLLIGHAKDNVEILASAIDYLNMWQRTA